MIFASNGTIFNTLELKGFETGDPNLPVVYLDFDSSRVFAEKRAGWKSEIIEMDGDNLKVLTERYPLRSLTDALSRTSGDVLRQSQALLVGAWSDEGKR